MPSDKPQPVHPSQPFFFMYQPLSENIAGNCDPRNTHTHTHTEPLAVAAVITIINVGCLRERRNLAHCVRKHSRQFPRTQTNARVRARAPKSNRFASLLFTLHACYHRAAGAPIGWQPRSPLLRDWLVPPLNNAGLFFTRTNEIAIYNNTQASSDAHQLLVDLTNRLGIYLPSIIKIIYFPLPLLLFQLLLLLIFYDATTAVMESLLWEKQVEMVRLSWVSFKAGRRC